MLVRGRAGAFRGWWAAGVVLLALSGLCRGANLLGDPGFDASSNPGGFPNSGWWNADWVGEGGTVLDGAHSHSPPYSAHVYTGVSGGDYLSRPYHDDVAAAMGKLYKGTAFVCTPAGFAWQPGAAAFVRISFRNSSHAEITHADSPAYTAASAVWQALEVTSEAAPAGTAYVRFILCLQKPQGASGQSIVNVDDCVLEEASSPPSMAVSPAFLSFGATNAAMVMRVVNTGGSVLDCTVAPGGQAWITGVAPTDAALAPGEAAYITVTVDRTGLAAAAEYEGSLTVSAAGGSPVDVPVRLTTPSPVPAQPSRVHLAGTQLVVERRLPSGELDLPRPWEVKGFAWSPASVATAGTAASRRAAFQEWHAYDLGMMRGIGVNTVYTFLDFGLAPADYTAVLDSLYQNGVMAIVTVDNDGHYDLDNLQAVVAAYRNHPAVLAWAIGNEWTINYYHDHFGDHGAPSVAKLRAAAEATETAAQRVKGLDTLHPVLSIMGEIEIVGRQPLRPASGWLSTQEIVNTVCPSVDAWGANLYRGDNFGNLFGDWASITSKPLLLSEFGVDSLHTTVYYPNPIDGCLDEPEQAAWNHSLWQDLRGELSARDSSKVCLGGTFFEWNDEWFKVLPAAQQDKGGFYTEWNPCAFPDAFANEEYFGAVRLEGGARLPKAAYYQVKDDFAAAAEDGVLVRFTEEGLAVEEGDGARTVTVTLSRAATVPVTVEYATAAGSATAGDDYTEAAGELELAAGTLTASFAVAVADDGAREGPETVRLLLRNPDGAGLGMPNQATLTILDNDNHPPEVEITGLRQAGAGRATVVHVDFRWRDVDADALTVTLQASADNGATWAVPVATLAGDTAVTGAAAWQEGTVSWSAGADWPEHYSEQMKVKLIADDEP